MPEAYYPLPIKRYVLTDGHEVFGEPLWMNPLEAEDASRRALAATGGNLSWIAQEQAETPSQPAPSRAELNRKLTGAVVRYDETQAKRKFYNRYALAQYCEAISNILDAVDRGADLRAAILDNVQGPLATACLRAVGLPAMQRSERR
jgi:hypothetical protein